MTVQAPPQVVTPLRRADLVERFLARLADWVALDLVLSLLLMFTDRTVAMTVFLVVNLGYYVILEVRHGRTLGHRWTGLEVLGPDGGRPSPSQSLRRHLLDAWPLGYVVPAAGGYVGALTALAAVTGALTIAVELHRRPTDTPWHDRLAGGTVVLGAQPGFTDGRRAERHRSARRPSVD